MSIVTIPQKIARNDDLVVMPRREYEALLRRQPKLIPVVKLTPSERRAIAESEKELARGAYVTLDELERELGGARTKAR